MPSGFYQIAIRPDGAHKTAISTSNGHEFFKMPFELLYAPRQYTYVIGVTLAGLIGNEVIVYNVHGRSTWITC